MLKLGSRLSLAEGTGALERIRNTNLSLPTVARSIER